MPRFQPIAFSGLISKFVFIGVPAILLITTFTFYQKSSSLSHKVSGLERSSQEAQDSLKKALADNKELIQKIDQVESQKNELQDQLTKIRQDSENGALDLHKLETQLSSAREEKSYLEEMLIAKSKEIERLRTSTNNVLTGPTDYIIKLQSKEEEIKQLTEKNQALSAKLENMHQTMTHKLSDIHKSISEEWNSVHLGSIKVDPQASSPSTSSAMKTAVETAPLTLAQGKLATDASARPANRSSVQKIGHILTINQEHRFVVVDIGKRDKVRPNSLLYARQNGQNIATLSVIEIRDTMSACNIKEIEPGRKLQVNDPVVLP